MGFHESEVMDVGWNDRDCQIASNCDPFSRPISPPLRPEVWGRYTGVNLDENAMRLCWRDVGRAVVAWREIAEPGIAA